MRHEHTWRVTVTNPTVAQLWVPYFQSSTLWVTPGANITLMATVRNEGPATAGPFDVEFFLSPPGPWTTNDIYLGKVAVSGLAAAQQTILNHQVTLPWRLPAAVHYVYAVVDRANAIVELLENDNERVAPLIGQAGACVTRLEYADPLLYPHDAAALSTAAGGTSWSSFFFDLPRQSWLDQARTVAPEPAAISAP